MLNFCLYFASPSRVVISLYRFSPDVSFIMTDIYDVPALLLDRSSRQCPAALVVPVFPPITVTFGGISYVPFKYWFEFFTSTDFSAPFLSLYVVVYELIWIEGIGRHIVPFLRQPVGIGKATICGAKFSRLTVHESHKLLHRA